MEMKGLIAAFIDVPQEHTGPYNTWYDFDHLPEYVGLPGYLSARRYVATPDCKAARPPTSLGDLDNGQGSYFTTYLLGTDDIAEVMGHFQEMGAYLRREKRIFRHGRVIEVGFYKTEYVVARDDIPVLTAAVPFLGHRGVMAVLATVPDPSKREVVNEWFREVHAPDVMAIPGVVNAMRFSRFDKPELERYLNLYMLDGDPAQVVEGVKAARESWIQKGTSPSPGGASVPLFNSPYQLIHPTEYSFKIE